MKHHCVTNFQYKCLLSATIFNLYGWMALITSLILIYMNNINKIIPIILIILLIPIVECIGGQFSHIVNGKKTWSYDHTYLPFCDGYVSLITTIYFSIFIILYSIFIHPLL